jgi:DNA replication factor GINS
LAALLESVVLLNTRLIERDYEEEEVRLAYTGPPIKLFIEDDYVELTRGSEYTVPRWLAEIISEAGYGKINEQLVDEGALAKIQFNEARSRSQLRFEKLQGYFYQRVRDHVLHTLSKIREVSDLAKTQQMIESITKISALTRELYRTRLSKILNVVMIEVSPDVLHNLSEEEKHLYSLLKAILDAFRLRVFEVERRG